MKKKGVFLMVAVATFLMATWALAQQEVLKLEHQAFVSRQRPAVVFPHAQHYGTLACTDCHHFYENGKNVWDESRETNCAACHGLKAEGGKMGLMPAFHGKCLNCHRKTKAEGKNAGPVVCGECHVKGK